MWTRKVQRDRKKGVDSPVPTQVVSNEEFITRPQNDWQKQLEQLIGEMGAALGIRMCSPTAAPVAIRPRSRRLPRISPLSGTTVMSATASST